MTTSQNTTALRTSPEMPALRSPHTPMRIGAPIKRAHALSRANSKNSALSAIKRD